MSGPRSGLLFALALATVACSESKTNQQNTCPEVPCDSAAPGLSVGVSEPGGFKSFVDGQSVMLDFGPQGGQHFYADLLLASATSGQWDFALELTDELAELSGYSEAHVRACPCETLRTKIAVIVNDRQDQIGTLSVRGTEREHGRTVSSTPVKLQIFLP
jgi:hypothetical protein